MTKNKKDVKEGHIHLYDPIVVPKMRKYCDKLGITYTNFTVCAIEEKLNRQNKK